ncbi:MAG: aldo/keto reductase [Elusimicrobiota bacterium]
MPAMPQRLLGRTNLQVAAVSLGTMNFGAEWLGARPLDEAACRDLVDCALDHGANLFDTADVYGYGAAETMLGRIIKGRRERVLIATKVLAQMKPGDPSSGGLSARHIAEGLDDSLRRLQTDYVDLYMPHNWDARVPIEETLEALQRAVSAGKVRILGCSNFSGAQVKQCLAAAAARGAPRFEFNEVQYSLAHRNGEAELAAAWMTSGVSVLSWSPLGGGFLSGRHTPQDRPAGRRQDPQKAFPPLPEKDLQGLLDALREAARLEGRSPAQTALSWTAFRPWVASAIVGARSVAQLEECLAVKPLSPEATRLLSAPPVAAS